MTNLKNFFQITCQRTQQFRKKKTCIY